MIEAIIIICTILIISFFIVLSSQISKTISVIEKWQKSTSDHEQTFCDVISQIKQIEQEHIKKTSEVQSEILLKISENQKAIDIQQENEFLRKRQREYRQFFAIILQTLKEDSVFLRSELVRQFSVDLPQTREFNSQVQTFERRLEQIEMTLKEYNMIESIDE